MQKQAIAIHGTASDSFRYLPELTKEDEIMSLLDYLNKQNQGIASSCLGEGVCKKCIINQDVLSCQLCLLYTSPSPRDRQKSRMPSSA